MVSGASGWDRGRTEQGRTMVKFGRPWDAPGPCVSEGTEDPIRAPLKWQEAQGRHVTCFTKLPNRGMADLVWDVLGGAAEAPSAVAWFVFYPERLLSWGCVSGVLPKFHRGWGSKHHPHFASGPTKAQGEPCWAWLWS